MGSEKDSEYETYALKSHGEYARPYTRRNGSVYATPNSSGSEQKYENKYDEYGGHYAEYQKHSNCGRKINYETEYAEYECGRSETDSTKMDKKKKQWCIRCSIICLVLILLGAVIFGIIAVVGKPDILDIKPDNSTGSFEVTTSTEPVLSSTESTTIPTTPKTVITEPTEKPLPNAIELSGTTTENYWKDYQLLGLYNIHGTRNGAPSYKRARNAFILGEIYFWYVSRCGENEWVVTSKKEFDEDKDCPGRWLWKKSQDTDPSKIGHGQPEDLRTKWGEAEQFGGKMHTADISVKAFYN